MLERNCSFPSWTSCCQSISLSPYSSGLTLQSLDSLVLKHSLILCPLPLVTFCSKSPCSVLLGSLRYAVPELLTFWNLGGFTFSSLGIWNSECNRAVSVHTEILKSTKVCITKYSFLFGQCWTSAVLMSFTPNPYFFCVTS